MQYRVLAAPWWARWLLYGVLFAVVLIVLEPLYTTDVAHEWGSPGYAVFVVIGSVMFGGLIAATTQSAHREYLSAVAGLGSEDRNRAAAALRSGEIPTDPAVLAAAVRLGEIYLRRSGGKPWVWVLNFVLGALWLALGIIRILNGEALRGGLWIGFAVLFVAAMLWERRYRQRLQRNVETLRTAAGQLPSINQP